MTTSPVRGRVDEVLSEGNGILRLEPAWVARDWLPPGRRLGLAEHAYDVGERGFICERWLGSTTKADNRIGPPDEGLSYLVGAKGQRALLRDAVEADPVTFLGTEYARTHRGLERLAKIFDYQARIPYHIHPTARHASMVGCKPKDEAYYFPAGVDMGAHPESFFGVHPWIAEGKRGDVLLPYLVEWNSDEILKHARGEMLVAEEGFHIPSGVLHAPGTALTIELQEDSDVLAMFQALNAGTIISKDLLFKDVRPEDRERHGERFVLDFIDWELNGDPYFYENRHLTAAPVAGTTQAGGAEWWIFYNTTKFSGKKLVVRPGQSFITVEQGVHNILVWGGTGTYGGHEICGGQPGMDELFLVHKAATRPEIVRNTGSDDLVILKFFGPDINPDVPMLPPFPTPRASH
ncbi:MAG TPA: hypothetical protein VF462_12960 [Micromonosporaceae bacterium]